MVILMVFIFVAVSLIGFAVIPLAYNTSVAFSQKRANLLSNRLDRMMPRAQIKKILQLYVWAPVVVAGSFYFLFNDPVMRLFGVLIGLVAGFLLPGVYTKMLLSQNKVRFDNQLIDALMIMSSSFRGGLSLIQAMEAVVDEMPDPINQEFSTVLGENKMGVSLDEALNHLYNRMPSSALQQLITAILLARETGGNLPVILQRIIDVVREQKRIQGQIDTLTLQGKIQGVVMSLLPVGFFVTIYSSNPGFFDHMFQSPTGRAMLIYACISEVIGGFMIWKISTFKDF
ncbi:MAG: type II secretion system F family protein [Candidatus Omnitrophica bacterium]|nr:type II secretion system F family protein [Candidatus Omnitrophota bacterium]